MLILIQKLYHQHPESNKGYRLEFSFQFYMLILSYYNFNLPSC